MTSKRFSFEKLFTSKIDTAQSNCSFACPILRTVPQKIRSMIYDEKSSKIISSRAYSGVALLNFFIIIDVTTAVFAPSRYCSNVYGRDESLRQYRYCFYCYYY